MDKSIFRNDEDQLWNKLGYEDACRNIRTILSGKPQWADAVIAIRLDAWSVNEYAERLGIKDASVISHWLKRAEKKLKESYPGTSDFLRVYGKKVEGEHCND